MKVFDATYNKYHAGRGSYSEYRSAIVVATTESEALGFVLQEYSETQGEFWSFEEIDTNIPQVHHMDYGEI